jgi:hypothetical protein
MASIVLLLLIMKPWIVLGQDGIMYIAPLDSICSLLPLGTGQSAPLTGHVPVPDALARWRLLAVPPSASGPTSGGWDAWGEGSTIPLDADLCVGFPSHRLL